MKKRLNGRIAAVLAFVFTVGLCGADGKPSADKNNAVVSAAASVVENEYRRLLEMDDDARAEADKWILESRKFTEQGGFSLPPATLTARIKERLQPVRRAYEDFLQRNPGHARARTAFGSFLSETGNEEEAARQWEKALEADPKLPAVRNNLGNYYANTGRPKKAFEYFAKAIQLDAGQAVYYRNFASAVYLFRDEAKEYFHLTEQEAFGKAQKLYREAIRLAPDDFLLRTDYAQSFYGIQPPRHEEGLKAWQEALGLARDEIEKDGVRVHLARHKIQLGRLTEAEADLAAVTHAMYLPLKRSLLRDLDSARNAPNKSQQEKASVP